MYWQEDKKTENLHVTDNVVDMVFGIQCKCLPVDHVRALSESVTEVLPWMGDELTTGVHSIYGAASGNGWVRPIDPDALLHLSKRTKFELRVPEHRIEDARRLEGETLQVAGYDIVIKKATVRSLSKSTILFSRYLAANIDIENEEQFIEWAARELSSLGISPRKILCGTENYIQLSHEKIRTRSLMLADLDIEESLRLQEQGLGPHRQFGCGLFLPHKGINDIREEKE